MATVTSGFTSKSELDTAYGKAHAGWGLLNAVMTAYGASNRDDISYIDNFTPTSVSAVLSNGDTIQMYGSGFSANIYETWNITRMEVYTSGYIAKFYGSYSLNPGYGTESGSFNKIELVDSFGSQGKITLNGTINVNSWVTPISSVVWEVGGAVLTYSGSNVSVNLSSMVFSGVFTSAVLKYNDYTYSIGNTSIQPLDHFDTMDQFLAAKLAGNDLVNGSVNGDYLSAFGGNDTLNGGAGNDTLDGGDGNDSLDGGAGGDTMAGGLGNDIFVIDNAGDTVSEELNEGTDLVKVGIATAGGSYTLSNNVENGTLTNTVAFNLTGNGSGNVLTGNAAANSLVGGAGNDTLDGLAGNDTLDGGLGADLLIGGTGNDTYVVDDAGDVVTETSAIVSEIDTVLADISYTLGVNVENLVLVGGTNGTGNALANLIEGNGWANALTGLAGADTLKGYEGDDWLQGGDGNDTLDGGEGADLMEGGAGNDTYYVGLGDVVIETSALATEIDTVFSSIDYTLGDNLENLKLTSGAGNLTGTGNGLANVITGNATDNELEGKGGADTLIGEMGDDTYIVNLKTTGTGAAAQAALEDSITEAAGGGNHDRIDLRGTASNTVATTLSLAGVLANIEHLDASQTGSTLLNLTGNAAANEMYGNDAANILDGGSGIDALHGEGGDDTYLVDNADDRTYEDADEGLNDLVKVGIATANGSYTLEANVEHGTLTNTVAFGLTGNSLNNFLTGNAAANTLIGGDGNDTLDGGAGIDTLIGGDGNDTYIVDVAGDVIQDSAGIDAVKSSITYTLADKPDLEVLILTGSGTINGTGNALDNMLIGNAAANSLVGGGGFDILDGGAGNDTLDGGALADMMAGGTGNDTYIVDDIGDAINESSTLATEIDLVKSSISFDLSTPGYGQLENLTLTGAGNITGTGNAKANTIIGNDGRNTLTGGGGADILQGGKENDLYNVNLIKTGTLATLEDTVTENLNEGFDGITLINTVALDTATTLILGANIESLDAFSTGTTKLNLTGNALDNVLYGNATANILNGLAGADNMFGSGGNDTYLVDNTGDQVTEFDVAHGIDLVEVNIATAGLTYTLTEFVENARLTNAVAFNLIGNDGDNVLTGNAAANVLDGGTGADTLIGGAGNDIYVVENSGDVVTETSAVATEIDLVRSRVNFVLGANLENLMLTSSGNTNGTGNTLANVLTGNVGNNILDGGAGNDTLDGGAGADTLIGGLGNDTYMVDNAGDVIVEDSTLGTEVDLVKSSVSFDLGAPGREQLENLTLTGTADINGHGNAKANILVGNDGANQFVGDAGIDTLQGGKGDDVYVVNLVKVGTGATATVALEDKITENLNEGYDSVALNQAVEDLANPTTLTLADNLEAMYAHQFTGATKLNLTGNAANNVLSGNAAANILNGLVGADTLRGFDGDDTYVIDNVGDVVWEDLNQGTDLVNVGIATAGATYELTANVEKATLTNAVAFNLTGNALNNVLTGNAAANTLIGGDGNDTLDGGAGVDYMGGGAGNDTYVVDATGDIVEDIGGGIDTVVAKLATGTYELTSEGVENLILFGTASINGRGNELANLIVGNDAANKLEGLVDDDRLEGWGGNDTLDGGLGVDTMIGGAGNDTYVVDSSSDLTEEDAGALAGVDLVLSSVDLSLAANIENLTLTGTAVQGFGNTLANRITGNASGNILDGNEGADTLDGGLGDDTYQVDLKTVGNVAMLEDTVIEAVGGGTDTLMLLGSGTNTVASKITLEGTNLENLAADYTGTTLLNLTGNAANNIITGNDADNLIDGGLGADGMNGGLGHDTYVLDNAGDSVTEASAVGGIDTLKIGFGSAGGTYVLGNGNNLENVTLTNTVAFHVTGNELNNALTGNAAANSLVGGLGDDTLDGLGGIDTLNGGAGDDTFVVDVSGDFISDSSGTDTVIAKLASGTYTLAEGLENLTLGGTAAISGVGNEGGNQLLGNAAANSLSGAGGDDQLIDMGGGNDTLDGGAGADVMMGGLGSDTYIVDDLFDSVTENIAIPTDIDLVMSSVNFDLSLAGREQLENLTLTGAGNINGTGNALNNKIIGNSGNNRLTDITGGNDSLVGGDGWDTLHGGTGTDTLVGGTGNDRYEVNLIAATGALEDVIVEVAGAAGGDRDVIVLQGSATNAVANTLTLAADIETMNASLTGTTKLNLTGNASNNTLVGNAADNVLDGGVGADTLLGGVGNDTYLVDNASDVVTEIPGEGTDLVKVSIATVGLYELTANVEHATLTNTVAFGLTGNAENNFLTGNAAANTLTGGAGNDTLDGLGGADALIGGTGDDTYVIDSVGDVVTELVEGGTDLVKSSVTHTLSGDVDNLTLTGAAVINGTGNNLDNWLTGNDAANVLDGKAGADIMFGRKGNDTYVVDDAGDLILEVQDEGADLVSSSVDFDLATAPNVENLTLTGSGDIDGFGSALANVITGNDANNVLSGLAGNDTLIGRGGADILNGGEGQDSMSGGNDDDQYYVDNVGDVVVEALTGGIADRVVSSISYTLAANVEFLALSGTDNLNGTGNALNNTLNGNSGNNVLNGGTGVDTYIGGDGNDTYILDVAGELSNVTDTSGNDTLVLGYNVAVATTVALTGALADIENLTASGTGLFNLTGNSAANILIGNASANTLTGEDGNDTLDGGAGNDTLVGGLGDDTYVVDSALDRLTEGNGEGIDLVKSSVTYSLATADNVENLTLTGIAAINATGNTLGNHLLGNDAANVLDGMAGADTLEGGKGNDTYIVDNDNDVLIETGLAGDVDLVKSSRSFELSDNTNNNQRDQIENLTLTGTENLYGAGNAKANLIIGNVGNNILDGAGGVDTLQGGIGNDDYYVNLVKVGNGATATVELEDRIIENLNEGSDWVKLKGGTIDLDNATTLILGANIENMLAGNDSGITKLNLTGNALNNQLIGNHANNILDGGAGNDTLAGENGNDTYIIDSLLDDVFEGGGMGVDLVKVNIATAGTYLLTANVENATLINTVAFNLTGNNLDNVLTGNAAANSLVGSTGTDTLDGGAGNDTLDGGAGNDRMIGGAGNDVFVVDAPGDFVVEAALGGIDRIETTLNTYTLGSVEIEQLTYIGAANFTGIGTAVANTLTGSTGNDNLSGLAGNDSLIGGAGNDSLDGGAGNDTLVGGGGSDTYTIDSLSDVVIENGVDPFVDGLNDTVNVAWAFAGTYTMAANVERAMITTETAGINLNGHAGGGGLFGNNQANVLDGKEGNDSLFGNGGDDTLIGGLGNDSMWGGLGSDVYRVDSQLDVVNENLNEGNDGIETTLNVADFSEVQHVEYFSFKGTGSVNLIGNALANSLIGGAGNDTLDGFGGDDTLIGGLGNDVYKVDSVVDVVIEAAGAGTDRVVSSINYTLVDKDNVENLTLTGAAVNAIGNALANTLTGNDGNNMLDGGAGNDSLVGGAGDDLLLGGAGTDTMIGGLGDDTYRIDVLADNLVEAAGEGTDIVWVSLSQAGTYVLGANIENANIEAVIAGINLTGNVLNNQLIGGDQANKLDGAAGNDVLAGYGGNDTLIGGTGDDRLWGGTGFDTLTGGDGSDHFWFTQVEAGADVITDFVSGTDVIELSAGEFAGLGNVGDLIGLSDYLLYNSTTGALSYDADGVGGNDAVQFATLGATTHPATLGMDFMIGV